MNENIEQSIKSIEEKAQTVAAEFAEATNAQMAALKAEAALLEHVVEAVKPALKAISSRPEIAERTWWPTNTYATTETTRADWKGLLVSGRGVEEDHPSANIGNYVGEALYLTVEGKFVLHTFTGAWSRWQGAASKWGVEDEAHLDLLEVVESYNATDIIAAINEALAKHDRSKFTKAQTERAEKFAALATLLGGGK
jgi:hypothetical protein